MSNHEENFRKLRATMDKLGRHLSKDILNLAGGGNQADEFLTNWKPRNPEEKALWTEITAKANMATLEYIVQSGEKGSKILWSKAHADCLKQQ